MLLDGQQTTEADTSIGSILLADHQYGLDNLDCIHAENNMTKRLANLFIDGRSTLKSNLATPVSPLGLLKITQSEDDQGRKVIQVKAGWKKIADDYNGIVSEYARVGIQGFRTGKDPRSLIEQRLRKKILNDLSYRASQRLGREALHATGTDSLGPIVISNIDCRKGKPFQFTAHFRQM